MVALRAPQCGAVHAARRRVHCSATAPRGSAGLAAILFAPLLAAGESRAASSDDVAGAVKSALDTASGLASQAGIVAEEVGGAARVAAAFVKPYADVAAPYVEGTLRAGFKAGEPLLRSGVEQLQRIPYTDVALKKVVTAAEASAPVVQGGASAVSSFVTTTAPLELGILGLLVLSLPLLAPLVGGVLRGYASDVSPLKALDMLREMDALLVDMRPATVVESRGVPALPKGAAGKLVAVAFDSIQDKALRASLNDPASLEAESTARIIAGLKKSARGKPVILLDAVSLHLHAVPARSLVH